MTIEQRCVVVAVLLAGVCAVASEAVEDTGFENAPVRRGGVEGRPYWNAHSVMFMYPPAFEFKRIDGAVKYRFDVTDDIHETVTFTADSPEADLSPVWAKLRVGYVTVVVTGVDSAGKDLGVTGRRTFWRKATFKEGAYPKAKYGYGECAGMMFENLFNREDSQYLLKTGKLQENFANRYPTKMLSGLISGMVYYSAVRPERKDAVLELARKASDCLIALSEGEGAKYPGFPPTYNPAKYKENYEWSQRRRCMTMYPAFAARAYLDLYKAVGEKKYLVAAKRIGETYLGFQGEDGTWPLMVNFDEGPYGKNRLMPLDVAQFLDDLFKATGEAKFRAAGDRAFAYVEKNLIASWNWEGQFEDTPPTERYKNLTKHPACSTAIYLLERYPDDKAKLTLARELLRFAEDQFVNWERPYDNGRRVPDKEKFTGYYNHFWDQDKWIMPSVFEQYGCYAPVDASSAKLIRTYLALYRAEKDPLDLAKAKALADTTTRCTSPDGLEATWWVEGQLRTDIWPNCMSATAKALCELSSVVSAGACAGAADDAAKHDSTEMNTAAYAAGNAAKDGMRVLFIGNSITLHGPCTSIDWTNNWGMAASAPEKDFVHLVTRGVEEHFARKASVMVRNLADFERNYRTWNMTNLNEMVAFDPQVLVVALGENSPELKTDADRKDYYQAYRRLFGKFLDGRRTKPLAAVRGVFWPNAEKDAAMASAAGDYALPFVKADVFGVPGMDAKDAGWAHAGVAAHPGDKGMAEIARRILETLFPTESGFAAKVDGKPVKVCPIRISAMEFNRFPSELWQRPVDQTEVAGVVTVEADGATRWAVTPSRTFTNAVVRPLSARVKCETKDGEVVFTLPRPGHYTLELDDFHSPLQIFVEPKCDFAAEKKAATLYFGPGNHYAGEVRLKSHDRVYIDREAYVYGMFGIEDAEDVQISGYGVICGTVGHRCTSHCYGGLNPTPIWAMRSKKVKVHGPTVIDSACWCVSTFDCRDVEFSHVKVTGMWRYNTDGVDICNSQNVYLHDSFIHSFDDTIVIKGLVEDRTKPVGDIRVERCTCWCGWGGTLETGLETWASSWKNVVFEDCDLIHNSWAAMRLHLGGPCKVEDTTYRNIRIEYDASECEPEIHQNRDDKYTKRATRPWNGFWFAVHNDKMYGPDSAYRNPDVDPNEPFGSFGTATLEDIDITVEPGVPVPKHLIEFQKGTKLGEIKWNNVRINGKSVELR